MNLAGSTPPTTDLDTARTGTAPESASARIRGRDLLRRATLRIALAATAGFVLIANLLVAEPAEEPPRGLWLMTGRDASRCARADVAGTMKTAPLVCWGFGWPQQAPEAAIPVSIGGDTAFVVRQHARLQAVRRDGATLWHVPFGGDSGILGSWQDPQGTGVLVRLGVDTMMLLDAATGKVVWKWTPPEGARAIEGWAWSDAESPRRLVVFPARVIGDAQAFCFEFASAVAPPALSWQTNLHGRFEANVGPFCVLADMDNDGEEEVVVAGRPAWIGVLDLHTGKLEFDLRYPLSGAPADGMGRPYGLLHVSDLDGDGFRDVVMASCQVEDYVAVLRNRGGTALELVWSRFFELDFPEDRRELLPQSTSVIDVNGDGRKEIVLGAFNLDGDGRWHVLALDAQAGFVTPILDLPDRRFLGCCDLDGDGREEILAATTLGREHGDPPVLEAVDGATGRITAQLLGFTPARRPVSNPTPPHPRHAALFKRQDVLLTAPDGIGRRGPIVVRAGTTARYVWTRAGGRDVLSPFTPSALSEAVLAQQDRLAPSPSVLQSDEGRGRAGLPAHTVRIVDGEGGRELLVCTGDSDLVVGVPDLATGSGWVRCREMEGASPAVWQKGPGRYIVAALHPESDALLLHSSDASPSRKIALPHSIVRSSEPLAFDQAGEFRVLVSLSRGLHAQACVVFDGEGVEVWRDDRHGPYPELPAAGPLDAGGIAAVVFDDHGWQARYDPQGRGTLFAQAWHTTIPGRGDGSAYAQPMIGPFGTGAERRTVLSPGLMALEVLDGAGARLVKRDYAPDPYMFQFSRSAIGRPGPDQGWCIAMLDSHGMLHCVELANARHRWSVSLGVSVFDKTPVVAGDVDGDGRDDFLVGLSDGSVRAIGEDDEGRPFERWRVELGFGVRDLVMGDVDADGSAEIVAGTRDGQVRILR